MPCRKNFFDMLLGFWICTNMIIRILRYTLATSVKKWSSVQIPKHFKKRASFNVTSPIFPFKNVWDGIKIKRKKKYRRPAPHTHHQKNKPSQKTHHIWCFFDHSRTPSQSPPTRRKEIFDKSSVFQHQTWRYTHSCNSFHASTVSALTTLLLMSRNMNSNPPTPQRHPKTIALHFLYLFLSEQ